MLQKGEIKNPSTFQRRRVCINRQQPIFPDRLQSSIFGTSELNFCVRDGNRCGLAVITTGMVESLYPQDCIRKIIQDCVLNVRQLNITCGQVLGRQYRSAEHISMLTHPAYQLVVFQCPYQKEGNLILKLASHLDAFSVYPIQTQLPSCATGVTTGTPEVCPSRSSRTKDSTPQISYAHDRQRPNCLTTF